MLVYTVNKDTRAYKGVVHYLQVLQNMSLGRFNVTIAYLLPKFLLNTTKRTGYGFPTKTPFRNNILYDEYKQFHCY